MTVQPIPTQPSVPQTPTRHTPSPYDAILGAYPVPSVPAKPPGVVSTYKGWKLQTTAAAGYLLSSPPMMGYPTTPVEVYVSLCGGDQYLAGQNAKLSLEVYDIPQQKIIAKATLLRPQFPAAGRFTLVKLAFTPGQQATLEFRIHAHRAAHIIADWIVVTNPKRCKPIRTHTELLQYTTAATTPANVPGRLTPLLDPLLEQWELTLTDPLTDGTTRAVVVGPGRFHPGGGYTLTGPGQGFLRYDTDITGAIRVAFNAIGFGQGDPLSVETEQGTIVGIQDAPPNTNWAMWQPGSGFLCQVLKIARYFDTPTGPLFHNGVSLRTVFDTELGERLMRRELSWNPASSYHWELLLEPDFCMVMRDANILFHRWLNPLVFGSSPRPLHVYLGGDDGPNSISPSNITYANVKIYRKSPGFRIYD